MVEVIYGATWRDCDDKATCAERAGYVVVDPYQSADYRRYWAARGPARAQRPASPPLKSSMCATGSPGFRACRTHRRPASADAGPARRGVRGAWDNSAHERCCHQRRSG